VGPRGHRVFVACSAAPGGPLHLGTRPLRAAFPTVKPPLVRTLSIALGAGDMPLAPPTCVTPTCCPCVVSSLADTFTYLFDRTLLKCSRGTVRPSGQPLSIAAGSCS